MGYQNIHWPYSSYKLVETIRNFALIYMFCFGKNSLIHRSISGLQKYFNRRENSVVLIFMSERQTFGAVFLYKLPIRIQKYISSCKRGRISKIKVAMLYVSDLIRHINTSTWQENTPPWIRNLINSRNENKHKDRGRYCNNQ